MGILYELVRRDENARIIFKQFECLALLPADKIEATFVKLAKKALKVSPLFAEFIDYFDREWIKIVKPQHFSVFKRGIRTTGSAESFNNQINHRFKTHGNFFHFCEMLQKEELIIAQQLENYIDGTVQREGRSAYLKKRHAAINKYSNLLESGEMDPMQFLAVMANKKNRIVYQDEDVSLEEVEVESTESREPYGGDDNVQYEEFDDLYYSDASDSDTEASPIIGNINNTSGFYK